jgi:hypothetical protein
MEQDKAFQEENSKKKKIWLWLLGGCGILACITIGIIAYFLFSLSDESYPLKGEVSFPSTVKKGDNFDFVITLTNSKTESVFIKHFTLQKYVGLPSLLDAVRVMSVEPNMESEPIFGNEVQYPYFQEIKSGETLTVIFHMQAESTGTYYLDVGVYAKHPLLADPAFITAFWFGPAEIEITP